MRSNKGFTLIELLITIAILSIVVTTVTSVIVTGSKQFNKGNADANMQRQAQLVVNQIEDMVIDTNGGVSYTDYSDRREFVLYNAISQNGVLTYTKELIEWKAADETLTYSKWNVNYDSSANTYTVAGAAIYADQLMAEDITDFKIDLSDTRTEMDKDGNEIDIVQSVQITVGCSGNDGLVSYATSPVITLRNRMMLSDSPELIFPNTPVMEENLSIYIAASETATPVKINYPATTVEKGKTYKLYLMVNDSYAIADNLINWEIMDEGVTSSVDDAGNLTVGPTEAGLSLSIKVSYKDNVDKNATATVKVANGKEIKEVRIIPIESAKMTVTDAWGQQVVQYDPFRPRFDSAVTLDGFAEADKSKLVYYWWITKADNSAFDKATIEENGKSKLKLSIDNDDKSIEGEIIRIHLLVTAPDLGITNESNGGMSAYYDFRIANIGDTSDSYIPRGSDPTAYNYTLPGDVTDNNPVGKYYFCDQNGRRLTEYDYLIDDAVSIDTYVGSFRIAVHNNLPVEQDFYLKYIATYNNYVYERIFYIPRVQMMGLSMSTAWNSIYDSYDGLYYKLYGYVPYAAYWTGDKYTIEVQEIISNAPDGVEIAAKIAPSVLMETETNLMYSEVKFEVSENLNNVDISDIKIHSITVKIQMTGTEIFTYATLTFS